MTEDNKLLDKDNDGIHDRTERIIDYALAAILLCISVPAFFLEMIDFEDLKVVFYLVTALSGGLTMVKEIVGELVSRLKK